MADRRQRKISGTRLWVESRTDREARLRRERRNPIPDGERICVKKGCGTVLSRYNRTDRCGQHG